MTTTAGRARGGDLSYNAGTFIGAACFLHDTAAARQAALYFMNNRCDANGLLPDYGTGGGNNCGFNGIFLRWMCLYMRASGTQSTFAPWLYKNAQAAWAARNSSGLAWDDWTVRTPEEPQLSWDCSPAVVALQVLPPNN